MPAPFAAIIPAAGASSRFGGEKLTTLIAGRSVLEWSVGAFLEHPLVCWVVVACPATLRLAEHAKLLRCEGGPYRADSVRRALACVPAEAEFVAIHDAARPAVSRALIDRVLAAAREHGAAIPGVPVTDTIKRVVAEASGTKVLETPLRSGLVAVQTPQAMRRSWLADAYDRCDVAAMELTDDAMLLELTGYAVHVVPGEAENLKLTTPADAERLEAILAAP